jgi:hypothetical protein
MKKLQGKVDLKNMNASDIQKMAMHVSNGDRNYQSPQTPGQGLMGLYPGRLQEEVPGAKLNDPVANITAAVKYISQKYHSSSKALQTLLATQQY